MESLSQKQAECMRWVALGLTSKEIGRKMSIAPGTVNRHVYEAVKKLGAPDRRKAAVLYLEQMASEKISPEKLAVDEPTYTPQPEPQPAASVCERAADTYQLPAPACSAPANGGGSNDLNTPLRTLAHIAIIAALIAVVFLAVPAMRGNAEWIADQIRPSPR